MIGENKLRRADSTARHPGTEAVKQRKFEGALAPSRSYISPSPLKERGRKGVRLILKTVDKPIGRVEIKAG